MMIGILAFQGGYQAHAARLTQLGISSYQWVRYPQDLSSIDGLILPGGESSVFLKFLESTKLFAELQRFNKPILGTCAGAILLAEQVTPSQPSLNHIEMTVTRNAYGRQLDSHIQVGHWTASSNEQPLEMAFIRAPMITSWHPENVRTLAKDKTGQAVAVQQGGYIATCFHPELTTDITVHQYFIKQVQAANLQETI